VSTLVSDPSALPTAKEIMRFAGEASDEPLVAQAIANKGPGLDIAEQLIGRRVIDELNRQAPSIPWHLLGPAVERLAAQSDERSASTLRAMLQRPDEPSRREVVIALAGIGTPAAVPLLGVALSDPSADVATAAARALGKLRLETAAAPLAQRLGQLEIDGADYALAREIIVALGRTPGSDATAALTKVAGRRALIKRARHAEIQALATEALRARGGAA
jgi:hypothetical protein